jgi:integrative and conjugative element protein (TIGR02256 family)
MRAFKVRLNEGHKLLIHPAALEFIEAEAAKATRTETGGVLVGRGGLSLGGAHITDASGPGPKARRSMYSFSRDTAYCQRFLDRLAVESRGEVDYLGEWHKHHETEPRPSSRDITTSRHIAASPDYHVDVCLLFIIGRSNRRNSLRAFAVNAAGRVERLNWGLCTACDYEAQPGVLAESV